MSNMKQGYKQTDIGVIPEDWEVVTLGSISKYQGGSQPDISFFSSRQYNGLVRLIQIRDYKSNKYAVYIPEKLARRRCTIDDIMIGRYGPPIFQILKGIEGAYNVALIKAIPNQDIDKSFFYYTLKREDLFQLIELLSRRSSGQTGVDLVGLKSFSIGLPPKEEQITIATALSDTDALIAALDKKIAKKQQIKQGAMQQLLTGKKRLSGFSGEWVEKAIAEIGIIVKGEQLNKNTLDFSGKYPVINGGIQPSGYCDKFNTQPNTITISEGGNSCGFINLINSNFWAGGHCYKITQVFDVTVPFLYHLLKFNEPSIMGLRAGSGLPNIQKNSLLNFKLIITADKKEQTTIAQILTDMDNEIAQLEKERDKYKDLKAGMMQVLLTGRVRLV